MSEPVESTPESGPSAVPVGGDGRALKAELALQLRGGLPCVRCGYNLGGLSIRGVCPECGTPIRATLLMVVDPHAKELQPVSHAGLVAAGVMLWAVGALAAALLGWWIRIAPMLEHMSGERWSTAWARRCAVAGIVLSGIGALALVRPHARIPRGQVIGAAGAVMGMFVLAGLSHWIWTRYSTSAPLPAVWGAAPPADAVLAMLAQAGVLVLVIVGLRPNARLLAARSLLLRSGRVDRQTMYVMAGVIGLVAAGHLVNLGAWMLSGRPLDVALSVGAVMVAVGWMLFTIGLLGVLLDVARLCPVLLEPAPSLGSLLVGSGPGEGERGVAR